MEVMEFPQIKKYTSGGLCCRISGSCSAFKSLHLDSAPPVTPPWQPLPALWTQSLSSKSEGARVEY